MPETTQVKLGEKGTTYESSHPYYLNNSDSPGMILVNNVFDGRGYLGWRRSILLSLSAKRKLGFINETCKAPELESADFEQWSCVNDMIICWISNALSKDIADSVMNSKTAKELWDSLEQRFSKSNGAKLYHLQKELTGMIRENSDIAAYFTKLKRLWDELDGINVIVCCSCECICNGKAKLTKSLEDQRLIQFLMGLNDVYAQDENQREVYANTNCISDSGSFMAVGQARQQNNKLIAEFAAFMASGQGRNAQRFKHQAVRGTNTYQKHVQDDCYRLHGFPADFEFTNSRNYQPQIKANTSLTQQADEDIGKTNFGINDGNFEEQFSKQQLAEMMQMYKQSKSTQAGKTGINANAVAGTILKYSNSVPTNLKQDTWIIDSEASEHICFDPNSFLFLNPLPMPLNINLPNSFKVRVTHTGSISIFSGQVITDVLLVPDFKYNLLSIHKFCVQFQYDVLFTATGCFLQDLSMKSP
ncbi:uncharacterized protein LOC129884391 [Solanum dulcamara]|uniref:uncharacterized protein LOC129884391 n=1 Tax=Solanum dulcamara TaxID=45834 RepID=UPI002486469F|nr:uncharacterized protein LOC129884391 [Solanum dulcamara]